MKKNLIVLYVLILLISCQNTIKDEYNADSINSYAEESSLAQADTTIVYDLEGVSLEGSEAKVTYAKGKIRNAEIKVFGETGQAFIQYGFEEKKIQVTETIYHYKTEITQVKSKEDMELKSSLQYSIDYNGDVLGKQQERPLLIFDEFKKSVPFYLNSGNH